MFSIFSRNHPAFQTREIQRVEVDGILRRTILLSVMGIPVGYVASGIFFTAFGLHMGMTKLHFGVLGTMLLLIRFTRLLAPAVEEREPSRKRAWFMLISAARIVLLSFVLGMFVPITPWMILAVAAFYTALHGVAVPLWHSWTWDYVPPGRFARFWARRNFWRRLGDTVFLLGAAFALDRVPEQHQRVVLCALFALFIAVGLVQAFWHLKIPEPPRTKPQASSVAKLADALRNRPFRNLLLLMGLWTFADSICSPFVNPYLLEDLGLSSQLVVPVLLRQVVPTLCALATLGLWGRVLDGPHVRPAVIISVLFWCTIPLFYYLAEPGKFSLIVAMLLAAAVLSGIFPVGFGLAKVLLTARLSGADKTMPAALMAVVPSLGGAIGATIGTYFVGTAEARDVFILSLAARAAVVPAACLLLRARGAADGPRAEA